MENSAVVTELKKSVFHSVPKERQCQKNSSWKDWFIGRTDAKAETPILWPPDWKNWLIGKDSGTRDQIANICCVAHNKLWKILKEMGIPDDLTCLLRNLLVKKQQLEWDMQQQTDFKLGKEYIKAVYCPPAYLTSMQSTSCKMLGWMKHKLESKLLGEISITSKYRWHHPYGRM